jgi:hypothetical protein
MKSYLSAGILTFLFFVSGTGLLAQGKAKKDEQFNAMVALIESNSFEFEVQNIQPTGGRNIRPTSIYIMSVEDGLYKARLPYFGRAYQASVGGDVGIVFEGKPEELKVSTNEKKRNIDLSFKIQGENDRYTIFLNVGYSGYGNLSVTSVNRQPISYSGIVRPLKKKDQGQ